MKRGFGEELNNVGLKMRLPWFNQSLLEDRGFTGLVEAIQKKREETSLHNILHSLLPLSEYVAQEKGIPFDRNNGKETMQRLCRDNADLLCELAVTHGTQGNVPQRAAILLDYFCESGLFTLEGATVIELGCSAGLLGTVFCSYPKFFLEYDGFLAKKYFWLKRFPRVPTPHSIKYIGYDCALPSPRLVPFYIWDEDKREKVRAFAKECPQQGELHEKSFNVALKTLEWIDGFEKFEPIIILTSFVLYQLTEPDDLIQKIMNRVNTVTNVHWLDLSRNDGLDELFGVHQKAMNLVPDHIYLSHNGVPVAHVINGSDDCPDWEYL